MRVKVVAPHQVCHDEQRWRGGESADVPDDVAKSWLACGWVVKVAEPAKKVATKAAATK